MKPLYLLFIAILFVACKKQEVAVNSNPYIITEPDFALIPTNNAKWYIEGVFTDHAPWVAGFAWNMEAEEKLHKFNYLIETTGKDTLISGKLFHVYNLIRTITFADSVKPDPRLTRKLHYYLREDTLAKKVYHMDGGVVIDFTDEYNKGQTTPFFSWREVNITEPDSLIIAGHYLKRWNMRNIYDEKLEYFYKARGIGTRMGILFESKETNTEMVTKFSFVYKGDSIHFEYPLQ